MSEITVCMANFKEEVEQSPIPVLLDFWAPWCAPCRMIAPSLAEIAEEREGRLKVGLVNVDKESGLAEQHGVVSIPSLVIYKDGAVVKKHTGAAPKDKIEGLFKDLL